MARDPKSSLLALITEQDFRSQVAGWAEGAVDAKQRDLPCFLQFYVKLYRYDDHREWFKLRTEAFLKLKARGHILRPSTRGEAMPPRLFQLTIARIYATVRHFAGLIHTICAAFPLRCPSGTSRGGGD